MIPDSDRLKRCAVREMQLFDQITDQRVRDLIRYCDDDIPSISIPHMTFEEVCERLGLDDEEAQEILDYADSVRRNARATRRCPRGLMRSVQESHGLDRV